MPRKCAQFLRGGRRVGGESLIRAVIEVPSQQDGDLGRFEHRRPITPGRGDDARDLCDSLATRQQRHADCPYRCTRSADGHLTPGTARCFPSRNQQRRGRYRSPARRAGAILRPTTNTTPPPSASRSGRSRRRRAQRPPTASHDLLGLDIGGGRSGSNPTSAIVLSQRAAHRRQRDDLIALQT
jgi:hypothetical protein